MAKADKERHSRALAILGRVQRKLVRRLTGFVIENEASLENAADGAEGYGYTVHQIDELFLSRLNLIERSMAELQKLPAKGVSRYRTICFVTSRDGVEKEVNSRLEKIPEARILGISVGPADFSSGGPERGEARTAGRQSTGAPSRPPPRPAGKGQLASSQGVGNPGPAAEPSEGGLIVTVLYYGPAPSE